MAYAYQQVLADEPPDNMDGSINAQVLPQHAASVDPSFGDGGTKRSLQERQ